MNRWIAEFFSNGHPLEYILNMDYWEFYQIQACLGKMREPEQPSMIIGAGHAKKLLPSQIDMIERRKEQRAKEGIKIARGRSK